MLRPAEPSSRLGTSAKTLAHRMTGHYCVKTLRPRRQIASSFSRTPWLGLRTLPANSRGQTLHTDFASEMYLTKDVVPLLDPLFVAALELGG